MLFKKALLPIFVMAALYGCGEAALDGSSISALDESIAKVASKMPSDQRFQFNRDIEVIKSYYANTNSDQMLFNLNGKSAMDIMSEADNIRAQLKIEVDQLAAEEMHKAYQEELRAKREVLLGNIKPMKENKAEATDFARFLVDASTLHAASQTDDGSVANSIDMTLTNGTKHDVYAAFFKASMTHPEHLGMLFSSPLSVVFVDPLKPGETRSLKTVPTLASDWRAIVVPDGAVFELEAHELMNIANKPIYSATNFTPEEQAHLEYLEAQLSQINEELGIEEPAKAKPAAEAAPAIEPVSVAEPPAIPSDDAMPVELPAPTAVDVATEEPLGSSLNIIGKVVDQNAEAETNPATESSNEAPAVLVDVDVDRGAAKDSAALEVGISEPAAEVVEVETDQDLEAEATAVGDQGKETEAFADPAETSDQLAPVHATEETGKTLESEAQKDGVAKEPTEVRASIKAVKVVL
jgi:hypothetical protein